MIDKDKLIEEINKLKRYDIHHHTNGFEGTWSTIEEDKWGDYIKIEELAPLLSCLSHYPNTQLVKEQ